MLPRPFFSECAILVTHFLIILWKKFCDLEVNHQFRKYQVFSASSLKMLVISNRYVYVLKSLFQNTYSKSKQTSRLWMYILNGTVRFPFWPVVLSSYYLLVRAGKLALPRGACHTVMWGLGWVFWACSVLRSNYQECILICILSTCYGCSPFAYGNIPITLQLFQCTCTNVNFSCWYFETLLMIGYF